MQDNRTSTRYVKRLRAVLVTEEKGRRTTIKGRTHDVSIDGASFISEYNIVSANPVTICLLIDPGDAKHPPAVFEAQGKIVNSVLSSQQGGFRLGIHFIKVAAECNQMLRKFLAPPSRARPMEMA
ncbi:MAG: PilZ domain-containing protein [Sterolibacterium sp.]